MIRPYESPIRAELPLTLGGEGELERTFDLFRPPPLEQFEPALQQMRDRLWKDAQEGGWEV